MVQDTIELKESTEMTFGRFVDEDYSEYFFDLLNQRRNNPEHCMVLSISGSQGGGKSMTALSIACYMDPDFSADRVFFSYSELVDARSRLPDNCCVVVDEQSQVYGLDAHRIMVILSNLKEQLRKRGISFIFCAPVLYEEAKSSMFQIETVYIDEAEREVVAALKTREGLVLGHIRVPHPLKVIDEQGSLASKELIDSYQKKKDEHLERVLGRQDKDQFETYAEVVMRSDLFKQAERVYLRQYRYIPVGSLQHIVSKVLPELGAGVVVAEVAGRIKLQREITGVWQIAGHSNRTKQQRRS
jgi:hypothetical protein